MRRWSEQVAAARWAPSDVARIDGDHVTFELRATVAQLTGQDWSGVALRLSTAEPERFGALPELAAQRIGRRQADTVRAIDDRGLVSWSVAIPPLGRRAVTLEYRVRSQRGVAGV